MIPFACARHDLGEISLHPLLADHAGALGEALATIPPWSTIGYPAKSLANWLGRQEPTMKKFEIHKEGLAGVIVIQEPFLHGPYLKLIAVLPDFQGRGFGERLLQWMEEEGRRAEARQLWLCVSTFNERAKVFYERMGFQAVALLEKLATDASDEFLMQKRLGL